jgi:tetratricopeptide (TPR) repeat protein
MFRRIILKKLELTDSTRTELQLMTTGLYFGEFAAVHALLQQESRLAIAMRQKDLVALKKYATHIIGDLSALGREDEEKYDALFAHVQATYEPAITQQPIPLPDAFLEELAEVALQKGKYLSAHNTLQHLKRLDKKVNEYLTQATQALQSKIVAEFDKTTSDEALAQVEQAAQQFYHAVRLKKPLGVPFQYLGVDFFTRNIETRRKFERHVEQGESVLKEIMNFCIAYLVDDAFISDKIINSIKNNRTRKHILKQLVIQFTGGIENHQMFVNQIREAAENVRNAKTELDFMQTQRILLGRTTGSDTLVQYLKELSTRFPVSPLMIKIDHSPANVPFLAPLMLKERSLLELLELD